MRFSSSMILWSRQGDPVLPSPLGIYARGRIGDWRKGLRRQGSGGIKNDKTAPPARDMQKK